MSGWQIFWTIAFLVAGVSFAFVTLVVTARGFRDSRELFARLRAQKDAAPGGPGASGAAGQGPSAPPFKIRSRP